MTAARWPLSDWSTRICVDGAKFNSLTSRVRKLKILSLERKESKNQSGGPICLAKVLRGAAVKSSLFIIPAPCGRRLELELELELDLNGRRESEGNSVWRRFILICVPQLFAHIKERQNSNFIVDIKAAERATEEDLSESSWIGARLATELRERGS